MQPPQKIFVFAAFIQVVLSIRYQTVSRMSDSPPVDGCWKAYEQCDFDFFGTEPGLKRFDLETPDVPFTPQIISKIDGQTIGILNSNGISQEVISRTGIASNITTIGKPRLTPDHFRPLVIPQILGSGVGFSSLESTQLLALRRRCIRVHFTEIQLITSTDPMIVENIMAERNTRRCVVFITRIPSLTRQKK